MRHRGGRSYTEPYGSVFNHSPRGMQGRATHRPRAPSTRYEEPKNAGNGGGTGIRTLETLAGLPVFKTGAFDRSAIPPRGRRGEQRSRGSHAARRSGSARVEGGERAQGSRSQPPKFSSSVAR